jgi:hypothetical protein
VAKKLASVIDRIHALLAAIERGDQPDRARLEDTLTDGYAWALSLDAECARLERRISEQAAVLSGEKSAEELSSLARLLNRRRQQLTELRSLLAVLKDGVREAKVA